MSLWGLLVERRKQSEPVDEGPSSVRHQELRDKSRVAEDAEGKQKTQQRQQRLARVGASCKRLSLKAHQQNLSRRIELNRHILFIPESIRTEVELDLELNRINTNTRDPPGPPSHIVYNSCRMAHWRRDNGQKGTA